MRNRNLFVVVILAATGAGFGQISAPPVKMGLWKTTQHISIAGFQIPPEAAARLKAMGRTLPGAAPHTIVTESCATPENWKKMFRDMQHRDNDCVVSNQHQTATGFSADMVCKSSASSSTGHIDVQITGREKMQGKVHMKATSETQPRPIVMDMNFESDYQGSDCHGISPDSPKIIR